MPRFARAVSARHKAHAREPATTTQANEEDRRPCRREKDLDKKRNKAKGKSNDTHGYTHALTNGTHRGDVSADYATLQRAHAETATCVACITFAECGNTPPPPHIPTVTSRSSHPRPAGHQYLAPSLSIVHCYRSALCIGACANAYRMLVYEGRGLQVRTVRTSTGNAS